MDISHISLAQRIVIIGAAGGIGRQCLDLALNAGHHVIALVRNPEKISVVHPRLHIVKGDATDVNSIGAVVSKSDVIISAIGTGGFGNDKPTTLYSVTAANIVTAMKASEATRVYFISASGVEVSPVMPLLVRLVTKNVLQKLLGNMYADLRRMEGVVKESELCWTIIRPPRLTNQPMTGQYRIAINKFLKNGFKLSRADVAHFIINNVDNNETCKTTVEIGY